MQVNLRKVESNKDIDTFVKYKIILVKYHQQYANAIGLIDEKVKNYNKDDAKKHIGQNNYFQYIIEHKNDDVGIIEYSIKTSSIDNEEILYINKIYIDDKHRGLRIGREVIKKIKNEINLRIELECWYGMPANDFYKSLGMKEIKTRYILN